MRQIKFALAFAAALSPLAAFGQSAPANLPAQSVYGRMGIPGDTGPGQAIPFATLLANLPGAQSANTVYAGPASGPVTLPAFRALVGADLPVPSASTLGGVKSLTCATSNWFNTLSTSGVLGCSQPNFTDLAGSIAGSQIPTGTITSTMILDGTILNADINSAAAIVLSKLAAQANNTFVGNVSGSSAVPIALTPGQVGGALCVPSRTVLTTGTAQTYTTPTCNGVTATSLEVDVQGGGGGGGASGTSNTGTFFPTAGNASSFGALTASGATTSGSLVSGGIGGACSGSLGTQQNFPGSAGGGVAGSTANNLPGGQGSASFYGGYGAPTTSSSAGQAAPANSGGGGSGGSGNGTASVLAAGGGGAGCHIRTVITSPAATYTYTVGASAAGATGNTSGNAGGAGAAGLIDVIAHWQ